MLFGLIKKEFMFVGRYGKDDFNVFYRVRGKFPSQKNIEFVENYIDAKAQRMGLPSAKAVVTDFKRVKR